MRIVIATPLYPPDIAEPAPYVKELATRLAKTHTVTVVIYGSLPEKVTGVEIVAVSKLQPLLARLMAYTKALRQALRTADVLIAENGASVELPFAIIAMGTRKPCILHIGDVAAHMHAKKSLAFGFVEHIAHSSAKTVFTELPLARPELLPLSLQSSEGQKNALDVYERSWSEHLAQLETVLTTYVRN